MNGSTTPGPMTASARMGGLGLVGGGLADQLNASPKVSVQNLLDEQNSLISDLASVINELESRLSPVIDPVPPQSGSDAKMPSPGTIVGVLSQHNDAVRWQTGSLRSIMKRLHI